MPECILITGGAGFIGSHLSRHLLAQGAHVRVLDSLSGQVHGTDPETTSPLRRSLPPSAEFLRGSVLSRDDLRAALEDVTVVVHLAAETGTGQSMYEIDRYVEANVRGTSLLLDVLADGHHRVHRLVVASSRAVYGEGAYITDDGRTVHPPPRNEVDMAVGDFDVHLSGEGPLRPVPTGESAALHPSSIYGITKQMQESLVMTAAPTFGIVPVALRFQNVFGPGQSLSNPYTGILSIFSGLLREDREVNVFEDGCESRDFVFVDDAVAAAALCALSDEASGVYNVGSGVATSVLDVAQTLKRILGSASPIRVSGRFRRGDIRHSVADLRRINALGWTPRVGFAEGVRAFVDWVRDQPAVDGGYERSLREMAARGVFQ